MSKRVSPGHTDRKPGRRSKYRVPAIIIASIGIALVIAAGALFGYNLWDSSRAEKESARIVEGLEEVIPETEQTPSGYSADDEMPVTMLDGYEYIGVLTIPSENLQLPVMADWDYTRLTISPCRFTGSYRTDDLVICAHNYASHFGSIQSIGIGVEIQLRTMEGVVYKYQVSNREILEPTAVEDLIQNENNSDNKKADWDLTLFTCNTSGLARCAVRCIRTN